MLYISCMGENVETLESALPAARIVGGGRPVCAWGGGVNLLTLDLLRQALRMASVAQASGDDSDIDFSDIKETIEEMMKRDRRR